MKNPLHKITLIATGFLFVSLGVFSQSRSDSTTNSISLRVNNFSYMRNYEYYNNIQKGYTLFGNAITPVLEFSNNSQGFRLQTGAFLQQDFGNTKLRRVLPVISLTTRRKYLLVTTDNPTPQFRKEWMFRMGTLINSDYHYFPEALYNRDQLVFNPVEYGTQFRYRNNYVKTDQWINWQRMIYYDSKGNERFQAGLSVIARNSNDSLQFHLSVPLYAMAHHSGGQIGIPGMSEPGGTTLNFSGGAFIQKYYPDAMVNLWSVGALYYLSHTDMSRTVGMPVNGTAIEAIAIINLLKNFSASISYWQSQDFYAPYGRFITQSRSSVYTDKEAYLPQRQLMFLKGLYRYQINNLLHVSVEAEPYYNLNESLFEYAYHVLIHYNFGSVLYQSK